MKNSVYITILALLFLFTHIKFYVLDAENFEAYIPSKTSFDNNRQELIIKNVYSETSYNLEPYRYGYNDQGQLRLSLYESSALINNESAADGVLILFDSNGNNDVDANDALDITNLDENFSTNNNGVLLSIETRAVPQDQEEIQLEVNTYRNTNYTIVAEGISIQTGTPRLFDSYTNAFTDIPQSGTVNYDYSINPSIPQSIASDRFKIIFDVETLSIQSVNLDNLLLYPNPTNLGEFYIDVPANINDLEIIIYDTLGSKLYYNDQIAGASKTTIDTKEILSSGTYFVELKSEGKSVVKKLVIH